ncbi:MAG: phosphoenolpyruvate hydrolase family protein [Sulfitobacter sp.]
MNIITIGGATPVPEMPHQHIYCPSMTGLTARLADATFLMPRIDQNQHVKDTNGHGHWAAALAADPFGSTNAHFNALAEAGYAGVVNWPSSILLEGQTQQQMSTIPATPAAEYAYLAKAQQIGLRTLGFILTPDHAANALAVGVRDLVLHPGILMDVDNAVAAMIRGAMTSIITSVKRSDKNATVRLYTSNWHDQMIGLSDVACDGFVRFEENGQ